MSETVMVPFWQVFLGQARVIMIAHGLMWFMVYLFFALSDQLDLRQALLPASWAWLCYLGWIQLVYVVPRLGFQLFNRQWFMLVSTSILALLTGTMSQLVQCFWQITP